MTNPDQEFFSTLFAGVESGMRCIIGDIEGEPVFALLIKLPARVESKALEVGTLEASWSWDHTDREGEVGLVLDLEIAVPGQSLVYDRIRFPLTEESARARLRCLMRQNCLPAILLDQSLNPCLRVGFDWSAEERSIVSSLTSASLACHHQG